MYTDERLHESGEIALELLERIPYVEQQCIIIEQLVKDENFTLPEALDFCEVSAVDFLEYFLKKYRHILIQQERKLSRTIAVEISSLIAV